MKTRGSTWCHNRWCPKRQQALGNTMHPRVTSFSTSIFTYHRGESNPMQQMQEARTHKGKRMPYRCTGVWHLLPKSGSETNAGKIWRSTTASQAAVPETPRPPGVGKAANVQYEVFAFCALRRSLERHSCDGASLWGPLSPAMARRKYWHTIQAALASPTGGWRELSPLGLAGQ